MPENMHDPRKWLQVKNDLERQLEAGVLEPGDELWVSCEAEEHGINKKTTFAALRSLVADGRLEYRRGKYIVPGHVIHNPVCPAPRTSRRNSKQASIASSLRSRITEGKIMPGTMLRFGELSREYGVSEQTVRAAVKSLVREGMVKVYPGTGSLVIGAGEPGENT